MDLLPLELTVTVGVGSATLFLGFMAWWRNKWVTGNVLYALIAFCLSIWTLADWLLSLQSTALPFQMFFWRLTFYATVCFGPALIIHATTHLANLPFKRENALAYMAGVLAFSSMVMGTVLRDAPQSFIPHQVCLQAAAGLGLLIYVTSVLYAAFHLYPLTVSQAVTTMERRRATYGIVILTLFALAGILQLIIGPLPVSLIMPAIALVFLTLSLMSFVRASFLEVELGPLEAFFILLAAYAVVILLRSANTSEAVVALLGSIIVGLFGALAIYTVKGERSKRKFLEDANRQLRMLEAAKSDFVDMVAHQLRGPLGSIRAASSMIAAGDYGEVSEKAARTAGQIQDTATRLVSLSDTFLNASRLEMGVYQSQKLRTDVKTEIEHIVNEMRTAAETRNIELRTSIDDDIPKNLDLDRDVLENVLFNLVDNAVKYTPRGSVTVTCRRDGNTLLIAVSDTGPGMTPDECRDLFKKFHRGRVGHMYQVSGSGLGLYVVKKLIEAAGGTISVTCPGPEKGSTFTARLPFDEANV